MIYTRQKKRSLNDQLLAQLPPDITAPCDNHYDADTARIFLHLTRLPEGATPVETVEDLREDLVPSNDAYHTPVTVVFVAVNHVTGSGASTRQFLADYVLPGHEQEQAQRIGDRRLYTWQPPKPIIYKGRVYQ